MKTLNRWVAEDVRPLQRKIKRDPQKYYGEQFHRDPTRPVYQDSDYFFSPADGVIIYQKLVKPDEKIVEVKGVNYTLRELMQDPEYKFSALVIGVFMSQWDVHINRIPYSGIISSKKLDSITSKNRPMLKLEEDIFDGKVLSRGMGYLFTNARELNTIFVPRWDYKYHVMRFGDDDVDVIVNWTNDYDPVLQNDRYGNIRYGSQCDLILPLPMPFEYELLQSVTNHVEAGVDALVRVTR